MSKIRKILSKGGEKNVLDFGAWGDGVHDDSQPLQLALNQDHYLYFPGGTYLVDGTLTTSKDHQVLIGAYGASLRLDNDFMYHIEEQEEAALTLKGNNQTVHNLTFAGPDFVDVQGVNGYGTDWYNLSGLRIKGQGATVTGGYVGVCEGVGIDITGNGAAIRYMDIEYVGLVGIRATAGKHELRGVVVNRVGKTHFQTVTNFPSNPSVGVQMDGGGHVFHCTFHDNANGLSVRGEDYIIGGNRIESGLHVEATGVVVSNNIVKNRGRNAITVANDGRSSIDSLSGNIIEPMDRAGADNIIDVSTYTLRPVKAVRGNRNAEIERVYQEKAHSVVRPRSGTTSDGRVPLKSVHRGELVDVGTDDTFAFPRFVSVKIHLPSVFSNEVFKKGQVRLTNETLGSTVDFQGAKTIDDTNPEVMSTVFQVYLRPKDRYRMYMFSDTSATPADVEHDENFAIVITDIE